MVAAVNMSSLSIRTRSSSDSDSRILDMTGTSKLERPGIASVDTLTAGDLPGLQCSGSDVCACRPAHLLWLHGGCVVMHRWCESMPQSAQQ